jgi:hypothetical protein
MSVFLRGHVSMVVDASTSLAHLHATVHRDGRGQRVNKVGGIYLHVHERVCRCTISVVDLKI